MSKKRITYNPAPDEKGRTDLGESQLPKFKDPPPPPPPKEKD